MNKQWILC